MHFKRQKLKTVLLVDMGSLSHEATSGVCGKDQRFCKSS